MDVFYYMMDVLAAGAGETGIIINGLGELGSSFTIHVKENELWIADKYHEPVKITLMGDDHLFTGYDFLNHTRIIRNSRGIIQYFELNSGDTTGLLFHKSI